MAFTNTVESVGDAALARSIVDRSITELCCNLTTSIRISAFRTCTALESVNFPSVTSVKMAAFWNCTALKKADFSACVDFSTNAFYGCTALTTLILRSADQVCTCNSSFTSSAIASGTGYIYVPAALVDSYKAASGWSSYADQIRAIEDYPVVCDPYTWDAVFACIADGTYASVYKVGDLVPLDLGSEGVVNMQIAGIDVDDLADGSGKAPISWISKELLATNHRMNPELVTNDDGTYQEGTGAIGGWDKCEMRTYLKDTIKPLIPEAVRTGIVEVTKTQLSYNTAGSSFTQTTTDDVWIPTSAEVNGYGLYKGLFTEDNATRRKGNNTSWWLRNAISSKKTCYAIVNNAGYCVTSATGNGCQDPHYFALGFCT